MGALYGKPFGVLPQVKNKGKKFLGWFDGDNKVNASTLVKKSGTVSLKAKWEEFTEEEIEMVTMGVYNHSSKGVVDTPFDELIKDADALQHYLRNPMEDFWFERVRVQELVKELGL